MIDLSNPYAASVFLAARPLFASPAGRALRKFTASFVFAAAAGLVVIAFANQVEQAAIPDQAAVAERAGPTPEYLAAIAKIEADERQEALLNDREAAAR